MSQGGQSSQKYSKWPKKYTKVLKSTEKYSKLLIKSTKKYSKVQKKYSKLLISTLKYPKVPKSTQKCIKGRGGGTVFFTGETTKVAKMTIKKYPKVLSSTEKYS